MSTTYLDAMKWRYATKKFDQTKQLSAEQLHNLLESIRLTATSMGLQLFKVLVVQDKVLRAQLMAASYNQKQVEEASYLLVFCSYNQVEENLIDGILRERATATNKTIQELETYKSSVMKTIGNMTDEAFAEWTAKQCYIALGNAMSACAVMGIDACPMEGFRAKEYNEILGLNSLNMKATLALPVGFRSEEDKNQYNPKIRRTMDDLVKFF